MKKSVLLMAIVGAGISTSTMAQQGSNPTPFNDTPIVKKGSTSSSNDIVDREIRRQDKTPRNGSEVIRGSANDVIDTVDLPKPPKMPLPETLDSIYGGVDDFKLKAIINGASIEHSQEQNVYRIKGGNSFKEVKVEDENIPTSKKERVKYLEDKYRDRNKGYGKEQFIDNIETKKQGDK